MKNSYIKASFLFVTALFLNTSCNDWLDEPKPESDIPIEELGAGSGGIDATITGAWAWWTAPQVMAGNLFVYPEALGDYAIFNNNSPGRIYRVYQRDLQVEGYDLIGEITQRGSRGENLANLAIKNIRETPPSDVAFITNRNRLLGEALFIRSWIHWEYILAMGDQWNTKNPAANANAVGPLIRFTPILDLSDLAQARTPLAAAYDSVITNLKKAEVLIPEFYNPQLHEAAFQVRANRFAASALLAKVYWQQNDFDNALIQVNKVLGNTPGVSNFPLATNFDNVYKRLGLTSNNAAKGEVILEYVAKAPSRISTRSGQVTSNTWYRSGRVGAFFGRYFKTISKMDSINDRRFKELITPNFTQTTNNVKYSSVWVTKKFSDNANIPFIRSAELLLMRAEINARKGMLTDAKKDLDLIRNRAGIGAYVITTQAAMIEDIITERIREMHAEGYRSHELKRLGALTDGEPNEVKFERGNRPNFDCGQANLGCTPVKWNDRRLTFLIPNGELNINPLASNP